MDTSKIVGEKIKSLRENRNISTEELAQRSGLAVEQVERIENNAFTGASALETVAVYKDSGTFTAAPYAFADGSGYDAATASVKVYLTTALYDGMDTEVGALAWLNANGRVEESVTEHVELNADVFVHDYVASDEDGTFDQYDFAAAWGDTDIAEDLESAVVPDGISVTRDGITGFQLDLKLPGIPIDLLCEGMERNRIARMKILDVMEACIAAPRPDISPRAPRLEVVKINPDKIGALIGPGGKNIRAITEETGTSIDIEEDGTVKIMAPDKEHLEAAKLRVSACTAEPEIGKIYRGKVVSIRDFGAFVEILPGVEGLLHISALADYRVNKVTDICNEGDYVSVKVLDIDPANGKISLSRKAALKEMSE